ncbi:MAG: ribbon-helix-helix domain-containing protein [Myxococcota bacterium]|nr:ribbon-helix-helix domain-containing protein [Myxococcota bacterium]
MRTKARTVVSAEPDEIAEVERLVRAGKYETVSDFVRQAMREKLRREHDAALAEELERYVRAQPGERSEDDALVRAQALPASRAPRGRRAKR